jgi:tetratricopeptide (TPR) repeat protein
MRKALLLFLPVVAAGCLTACGGTDDKTSDRASKPDATSTSQSAGDAPVAVAQETDSKWSVADQLVQGKPWGSEKEPLEELQANVSQSEKTPDMRLVMALRDLAGWYRGHKQYEDAEKVYKRIRDMEANRLGITDGSLPCNDLGVLYTDMGKLDQAEDQLKRLIARFDVAGKLPSPSLNDRLAIVLHNYSYLLEKLGRADESKKMEDRADKLMAEKKAAESSIH